MLFDWAGFGAAGLLVVLAGTVQEADFASVSCSSRFQLVECFEQQILVSYNLHCLRMIDHAFTRVSTF